MAAARAPEFGDETALLLPPGWASAVTEDGRRFFVDHRNQATQWEAPAGAIAAAAAMASEAEAEPDEPRVLSPPSWAVVPPQPLKDRPARIVVHLRALSNTPRLKKMKFKVPAEKTFHFVVNFLNRQLQGKLPPGERVFAYCSSAFSPAMDETIAVSFCRALVRTLACLEAALLTRCAFRRTSRRALHRATASWR